MPLLRNKITWEERIDRARELAEKCPSASQVLWFYVEIAGFQQSFETRLKAAAGLQQAAYLPFADALDISLLLPGVPELLSLVARAAPSPLADAARELMREEPEYWEYLLSTCWKRQGNAVEEAPETHLFFARALLQPYAAHLASRREIGGSQDRSSVCPVCSAKPLVGMLREEGYGAKRSLMCSLCSTEWDYARIICPACGESRFDRLAVYTAEEWDYMRVEACDNCKTYLKSVDLTKNGLAVPLVDELASLSLDLWARQNGFTKLQTNLLAM